jgi:hypothetical protein
MALDILRRTGGWMVELMVPIKHGAKTIDAIEIRAPSIGLLTRWQRGDIASSMALLAELSDIPESILNTITYPDADRVLMALFNAVPKPIQTDFTNGTRPLATPPEEAPEPVPGSRPLAVDDARFPMHEGTLSKPEPVAPAPASAPAPAPAAPAAPAVPHGGIGVSMDGAPPTMRKVV